MTTAAEQKIATQLLYLAVDLGEAPRFERFQEQVECLGVLQRYSRAVAQPIFARGSYPQEDVTGLLEALDALVITDVQRHLLNAMLKFDEPGSLLHQPAVLAESAFSIVRTSMASPWVTVLADLARSSQPVAYGLGALLGLHKLLDMVKDWQTHRQDLAERRQMPPRGHLHAEVLSLLQRYEQAADAQAPSTISDPARQQVADAVTRLDRILAADMVDPDDPKATGAA